MSEVKVPGGRVFTRDHGHSCATPEARKFDIGDEFECAACGRRFVLEDAQQYQGGPAWVSRVAPRQGPDR